MLYKILPHTADLKIKVSGQDKKELFIKALKAMFLVMEPKTKECRWSLKSGIVKCAKRPLSRKINVTSADEEVLLIDFLSAALTSADAKNEFYFDAKIKFLGPKELKAELLGAPIFGYGKEEIKAVTYHGFSIKNNAEGLSVEIIFDI